MSDYRITRLRGQYAITWDETGPDGRKIRRRYGLATDNPAEAARRAPSRYAELTRPNGTTVLDLWQAYRKEHSGRRIADNMQWSLRALQARFGAMEAESITIADCRAHVAERRKAGIKDGTLHTELGHLRIVLRWARKMGMIERAPEIERPPLPAPKDAYLTRDEIAALLDAAQAPHLRLAIRLLIGTGARIGAALELTWDRVDWQRRMIHLRNPFDTSKRKGRAVVPINGRLMAALQEAHAGALTPYVIEWGGKPVASLKTGLKRAGKKIGRPDVSPHMLRHSAAVWMAEDGHGMDEIAQFLGHSNTTITARVYARFSPGYLRKLADSLEI